MRRTIRLTGLCAAALAVIAMLPALAGAHERRDVADGQVQLVVGFLNEPASVGDKSGLDLRVSMPAPGATPTADGEIEYVPVEGADQTLQAEVYFGEQMMALTIEPRFGQPGSYASWFYPNAAGTYSFRVFGEINGAAIDETFTSGPETFGDIEERLLFPPDAAAAAPAVSDASLGDLPGGAFGGIAVAVVASGAAIFFAARERIVRREMPNRSA